MRTRRGFTLLELTITIMIAAIIMTALGVIVHDTVNTMIDIESEGRARRLGPGIMNTISNDLRNAWVTGPDENVDVEGSWFVGESRGGSGAHEDSLHFVTAIPSFMRYYGVSSDLTEVGYFTRPNDVPQGSPLHGLHTLYRRESFLVDARPTEGGLGVRMSDRVVSFRVRYYGLPRGAVDGDGIVDISQLENLVQPGSSEEKDQWDADDHERLPYAVRVELVLDVTPADSYRRRHERRIAVYESLVKLPGFPRIDEEFRLFDVQPPAMPQPQQQQNQNQNQNQ
jgi:prepilin-type N-terminal cleavage/methylation domain-containing protein